MSKSEHIYVEADEIGTHHECGYCSNADESNIIQINRLAIFTLIFLIKNLLKTR